MSSRESGNSKRRKASPATASTRSTAGPGFRFEDFVAAYILVQALNRAELPGIGTDPVEQVQTQVGPLGWALDDLLVTTRTEATSRRLSISCKDNVQVSANGFPSDFLGAAWRQWTTADGPMSPSTDHMMLATGISHPAFDRYWRDISDWARGATDLAVARIRASGTHAKFYNGVKRAGTAIKPGMLDEDVMKFLRGLHQQALDFQLPVSSMKQTVLSRCKDLLGPADHQRAEELWNTLMRWCTEARVKGDSIRLEDVWSKLAPKFRLRDRPDFTADWNALRALHRDALASVETTLTGGHQIARPELQGQLRSALDANRLAAVVGDSGCGKSALVKTFLESLPDSFERLWLMPKDVSDLFTVAGRRSLGLTHTIDILLKVAAKPRGVIVVDAAERLEPAAVRVLAEAVRVNLFSPTVGRDPQASRWIVVVIAQREAMESGELQDLLKLAPKTWIEVGSIDTLEVQRVLMATPQLTWLASHHDAVNVMTNVRTLGWVLEAPDALSPQASSSGSRWSKSRIVDAVFTKWTRGQVALYRFLVRLAEQEARSFARGVPITQLGDAAAAFDQKPPEFPVRAVHGKFFFVHDLAGEWARYEQLKEWSQDSTKLAVLGAQPVWAGAIRLLGDHLLHADSSATTWDDVIRSLDGSPDPSHQAVADLLLDAIFLSARSFVELDSRTEMFLADQGRLLRRLLNRFLHLATVPQSPWWTGLDPSMAVYVDAKQRTPIHGLWPSMALFLAKHVAAIGALVSPVVARTCSLWLNHVPIKMSEGEPYPLRKEFALVALATARELQTKQLQGFLFLDDSEEPIWEACFSGAPDLPDQVASWALETAGRRRPDDKVLEAVAAHRTEQQRKERERLAADPAYTASVESRRRRMHAAVMPNLRRSLPPWPLGAQLQISRQFQRFVSSGRGLRPLMQATPAVASEVLLAGVIESQPEALQPYDRNEKLGLEFSDLHPTAFWKGPMLCFLQVDAQAALSCLNDLVNFCTERWADPSGEDEGTTSVPFVELRFPDDSVRRYLGDLNVLDWVHTSSLPGGSLFCALAALEKWLCVEVDDGRDVLPAISWLLTHSKSVGILGVLINVGKYAPALFQGCLEPLLTCPVLFSWDANRVRRESWRVTPLGPIDGGFAQQVMQELNQAPHRAVSFGNGILGLSRTDKAFADKLRIIVGRWPMPSDADERLRFRIIQAQLDCANYLLDTDSPTSWRFVLPLGLQQELDARQRPPVAPRHEEMLPFQCREILETDSDLTDQAAEFIAGLLMPINPEPHPPEPLDLWVIAGAATLHTRGQAWLAQNADVARLLYFLLDQAADDVLASNWSMSSRSRSDGMEVFFLSHAAIAVLEQRGVDDQLSGKLVMAVLTQADNRASKPFFLAAWARRDHWGGPVWARLNELVLLWSALLPLRLRTTRTDEDEGWRSWVQRFARLPLKTAPRSLNLEPSAILVRLNRLHKRRFERQKPDPLFGPQRWYPVSLNGDVLCGAFCWLLSDIQYRPALVPGVLREGVPILRALLDYELERQAQEMAADKSDDGDDECRSEGLRIKTVKDPHPSHLGYTVLQAAGEVVSILPRSAARQLWEPILSAGRDMRPTVRAFLDSFFTYLPTTQRLEEGGEVWSDIIRYAVAAWSPPPRDYRSEEMLRSVMGFGRETSLDRRAEISGVVARMAPLYERWSEQQLSQSEDDIASLASFAASKTGSGLRLQALRQLQAALQSGSRALYWGRNNAGPALVELLDQCLRENLAELRTDAAARTASVFLINLLVSRQVSAALVFNCKTDRYYYHAHIV